MVARVIFLIALSAVLPAKVILADQADPVPLLPGAGESIVKAVSYSTDIIVGKFSQLDGGSKASIEGAHYYGKVTVLRTLRGKASGNLMVRFNVILGPQNTEIVPNTGDPYVMFMFEGNVDKFLPATKENVATVKQLVSK